MIEDEMRENKINELGLTKNNDGKILEKQWAESKWAMNLTWGKQEHI
jgi:hypothetical protein